MAETPEGPYTFQEVVLGDRGAAFWDGRMTHNPVVVKRGDTYLLFYIGTTFDGPKPTHLFAAMAEGPTGKPGDFADITRAWNGVVPLDGTHPIQ